jgi:hypothetical protein
LPPVLVDVPGFVLRPKLVSVFELELGPVRLLLPGIGTGPPQAAKAAAVRVATAKAHVARLSIDDLVMLTSLKSICGETDLPRSNRSNRSENDCEARNHGCETAKLPYT